MSRWFHGPSFLHEPESSWPKQPRVVDTPDNDAEVRKKLKVNTSIVSSGLKTTFDTIETRISSWNRQKKVVAVMLRFINLCRKNIAGKEITVQDMHEAEWHILRWLQQKYLGTEIARLKEGKKLTSTALAKLNPYTDKDDILRIGGRINNANIAYDTKHPIILPKEGAQQ